MLRARGQAEQYARALPATEGRPPFLIVVDVGHSIELYSEFTRSGATYMPFPDPRSHRIALDDLRKPEICGKRLRPIWIEPLRSTRREIRPGHARDRHAASRRSPVPRSSRPRRRTAWPRS